MAYFLKHFFGAEKSVYISEFGHSAYKEPKKVGPWSRAIYILHYVVKGYTDFSGFRAEAGQAFLISKELFHSFTTSEDYEHYWIGFDGENVGKLFENFGLKHQEHKLFFVKSTDFVKSLFFLAFESLQSEESDGGEATALSALVSVLPLLKTEKDAETLHKIDYAEKVFMFIKNNYMYPIKMEDIAKEIYISEKYMYRLFMDRFHISPQKYLKQTRMDMAKNFWRRINFP